VAAQRPACQRDGPPAGRTGSPASPGLRSSTRWSPTPCSRGSGGGHRSAAERYPF
jgi:hypothetical protein